MDDIREEYAASWEDPWEVEHADAAVRQHSYDDVGGALNGTFEQHVDGVGDGVDGVDYDNNSPWNCLGNIH